MAIRCSVLDVLERQIMTSDFDEQFKRAAASQEGRSNKNAIADLPKIKAAILRAAREGRTWIALVGWNAFPETPASELYFLIQYPKNMTPLEEKTYLSKIMNELGDRFELSQPPISADNRFLICW